MLFVLSNVLIPVGTELSKKQLVFKPCDVINPGHIKRSKYLFIVKYDNYADLIDYNNYDCYSTCRILQIYDIHDMDKPNYIINACCEDNNKSIILWMMHNNLLKNNVLNGTLEYAFYCGSVKVAMTIYALMKEKKIKVNLNLNVVLEAICINGDTYALDFLKQIKYGFTKLTTEKAIDVYCSMIEYACVHDSRIIIQWIFIEYENNEFLMKDIVGCCVVLKNIKTLKWLKDNYTLQYDEDNKAFLSDYFTDL